MTGAAIVVTPPAMVAIIVRRLTKGTVFLPELVSHPQIAKASFLVYQSIKAHA
jgi:hypothetical protein